MKLEILERLRKVAKSKIGDEWVGIEKHYYNGKWHVICIVYGMQPCRVEIVIGEYEDTFVETLEEIKRVPMHVVYIDSALRELENADKFIKHGKFDKAVSSLWGSIVYSLKAYGLVSKGCRIEASIMDLAKELSDSSGKILLDKVKRVQSALSNFDSLLELNVELLRDDAREVVESIVQILFR